MAETGTPRKTEEVFEVCVSEREKESALWKFMSTIADQYNIDIKTCPRVVVYVKNHPTAMHVRGLFQRKYGMDPWIADGNRKRSDALIAIDHFQAGGLPILIACDLRRLETQIKFENLTTVVFYDFPEFGDYYPSRAQLDDEKNKPKKVISYVNEADYPACKELMDSYVRKGKDVENLRPILDTLKPLYDAVPHSDDDEDFGDDEY